MEHQSKQFYLHVASFLFPFLNLWIPEISGIFTAALVAAKGPEGGGDEAGAGVCVWEM